MNDYIIQCYPEEACGFIISNEFIPVKNTADDPLNDFKISSTEYIKANRTEHLQAVMHSHINRPENNTSKYFKYIDPRTPSMMDMQGQQDTDIDWGIVATDGENVTDVLWFGTEKRVELLGRQFIYNVYDCFTLVQDYLKIHYDINVKNYPRPVDWENYDKKMYERHQQAEGFERLDITETPARPGDIIMFRIGTSTVNHAGIYTGSGKMIHHLANRLSQEDSVSKWNKQIAYWLRHKDSK